MSGQFLLLLPLLVTVAQSQSRKRQAAYVDLRQNEMVVEPYVTRNFTLTCTVTSALFQEYDRDSQKYHTTNSRGSNKEQLVRTRLLRATISGPAPSAWEVVAQQTDTDSNATSFEDGVIAYGDIRKPTYLDVTWSTATPSTLGKFVCDALVVFGDSAELKKSTTLEIGNNLKGADFSKMLEIGTADILSKVKEENNALKEQVQNLKETVRQNLADHTVTLAKIESQYQKIIETGLLQHWPFGSYALLEPTSGCPVDYISTWAKGSIRVHTESTQRNEDEVSESNHLKNPVLSRENGNNFVTQHFCVKTSVLTFGPNWPKGSYCINKKGECPAGFQNGWLLWDYEDGNTKANQTGAVPDSNFSTHLTMYYCCRDDGSPEDEISLPTNHPFYLYRRGGQCQNVRDMNVSHEFLLFDTENKDNDDEAAGAVPDVQVNNIRMELCYYHTR